MSRSGLKRPKRLGPKPPRDTPLTFVRQVLEINSGAAWRARWLRSSLARVILVALAILCGGLIAAGAAWGLFLWQERKLMDVQLVEVGPAALRFLQRVEEAWGHPPPPPEVREGDEASVLEYLRGQPCVDAVLFRDSPDRLWRKAGDRLVPGALDRSHRTLAERLWTTSSRLMLPTSTEVEDSTTTLRWAAGTQDYVLFQAVTPGTAAYERECHRLLGAEPLVQARLRYVADFRAMNFTYTRYPGTRTLELCSPQFSNNWIWTLGPVPSVERALNRARRERIWVVAALTVALLLLLALRVRMLLGTRAQSDRDNQRLASLTHSLQTPLAVLKARCDSLRFERLDDLEQPLEARRIGDEIDQLLTLIAEGAEPGEAVGPPQEPAPITRPWLTSLASAFEGAIQLTGRTLELRLEGHGVRANLATLKQVLRILLENALKHGAGNILLESRLAVDRLVLVVADQGSGLLAGDLQVLGRPFLKLQPLDAQGSSRAGMGVGLSLAIHLCKEEGWGLSFTSEPGAGLRAELEILVP